MFDPSELDFWAIEFDKTYPLIPEDLIGIKESTEGFNTNISNFCKRCGKDYMINHICNDVYYHIWNAYIHFVRIGNIKAVSNMKEKFGF